VVAGLGRRALLCTDKRQAAQSEFAAMLADLAAHDVEYRVFDDTIPDLPIASIEACVATVADFAPDVVVGVGGGSSMDMAKVVAVLLTHGGDLRSYYGEFAVPGPVMPLIAVPTTAGTGSEVTPVAVVADEERGTKIGIASPHLIPICAICDPELTATCPPALTACSGADALTHAIEAYTTLARPIDPLLTQGHVFVGKNVLSDHFASLAVGNIFRYLKRACADGSDMEARGGHAGGHGGRLRLRYGGHGGGPCAAISRRQSDSHRPWRRGGIAAALCDAVQPARMHSRFRSTRGADRPA
jgi:alcohol dehydrogenase class IV